jgi:predicted transcriptional regulator
MILVEVKGMTTEIELTPEQYRELETLAKQSKKSINDLIVEVVDQALKLKSKQKRYWPKGFFEQTAGAWIGELERPPQGEYEQRQELR